MKKERHKSDHFKLHSGSWVVQVVCQTFSDKCIKNENIFSCAKIASSFHNWHDLAQSKIRLQNVSASRGNDMDKCQRLPGG